MTKYFPVLRPHCGSKTSGVILLALVVSLLSIGNASAAKRIFDLHIKNGTTDEQSFTLVGGENCYEGTGSNNPNKTLQIGPLQPGQHYDITIARIQGHEHRDLPVRY